MEHRFKRTRMSYKYFLFLSKLCEFCTFFSEQRKFLGKGLFTLLVPWFPYKHCFPFLVWVWFVHPVSAYVRYLRALDRCSRFPQAACSCGKNRSSEGYVRLSSQRDPLRSLRVDRRFVFKWSKGALWLVGLDGHMLIVQEPECKSMKRDLSDLTRLWTKFISNL